MRFIERLNKPLILEQKEAEWTAVFLENQDKKRPDGSKYGHKQIREQLNTMSFHKCFYCESKLKGVSQEIDHYEEVSETQSSCYSYGFIRNFIVTIRTSQIQIRPYIS